MKRLLSCLVVAGALAIPALASAEPLGYPQPRYVRSDGTRFDSEVGAVCGTLHTNIYFAPLETALDAYDRTTLASLGYCFTRGPLTDVRIELVAGYDGSYLSRQLSEARLGEVIESLTRAGVSTDQLVYSRQLRPGWQSGIVTFRLARPAPGGG